MDRCLSKYTNMDVKYSYVNIFQFSYKPENYGTWNCVLFIESVSTFHVMMHSYRVFHKTWHFVFNQSLYPHPNDEFGGLNEEWADKGGAHVQSQGLVWWHVLLGLGMYNLRQDFWTSVLLIFNILNSLSYGQSLWLT